MEISTLNSWDSDGGAVSSCPDPVATPDVPWYAVQIRPRYELKADRLLRLKGIETFLPLLAQVHQWSDRRKQVLAPLFPGYGFIRLHLTPESRKRVLHTAGVVAMVGTPEAAHIPASQIKSLQRLLAANVDCAIRPFLHAGQRVRIRSGALCGVEGVLLEDKRKRLIISIECIQRSVAVSVDGYEMELA